jgi:hypothetical protein
LENEKEIPIPMSERVKISDLKFDQDNPNRMSLAQLDRLKASIRRWGDIVPVVTTVSFWWQMGLNVLPL